MFKLFATAAAVPAALLASQPALAAISVTSPSFTYSQDFDSLPSATATNAWANDSSLLGWSLFNSTGAAITSVVAASGSANAGSFYSYGDALGNTERALGGLASGGTYFGSPASGAVAGYITVALVNNSGVALNGFSLNFNGEQWRNGGNATAQTMALQYGLGASFAAVSSWTAAGAGFNWTSPVATTTAGTVDGNTAGRVAGVGGSVSTAWPLGETLWLRWVENNDVGNDHGLAIDDLRFSVSAVPEPQSWALCLAGVVAVAALARRGRA
jgi:hypothetical protein